VEPRSAYVMSGPARWDWEHSVPPVDHPAHAGVKGCGLPSRRLRPQIKAMSVAFTREEDHETRAADLPDRPVSAHPNLVTASGLAAIEAELQAARTAYAAAQSGGEISADRTAMARATRDLRYWSVRRASAQLTELEPIPGTVQFGRTVEIEREDGRQQAFRIVGEDEADPAKGSVSYVSPLARGLLGKSVGDTAMIGGSEVEVVAVR
jgi:transcription elongation GreA/GreB family factor